MVYTGKNKFAFSNGDTYVGDYLGGKRNGSGKYIWASGQSYDGAWVNDVMEGNGTYDFGNGKAPYGRHVCRRSDRRKHRYRANARNAGCCGGHGRMSMAEKTERRVPEDFDGLTLLEGELSVRAAVEGKKRVIKTVFVDKNKKEKRDRKLLALLAYLKQNQIPTVLAEREKIDALVRESAGEHAGHTHGGVIAFASERTYSTLSELLETVRDGDYFVCLDGHRGSV